MEDYDPTKDYKTLHIEWLRNNRSFRPKGGNPFPLLYNTYIEYMNAMYFSEDGCFKNNETAYLCLRDDYKWSKRSQTINEEVATLFGDKIENNNPCYFVTFNWTDANFNIQKALTGVERLFDKAWVDNARGVFEYYGMKDNHPHFHCIIQVNKYKKIYDFRKKMFESSLGSDLAKNFIHVKYAKDYHEDYVDLDKDPAKAECLAKDVEWREANGFAPEYRKKCV